MLQNILQKRVDGIWSIWTLNDVFFLVNTDVVEEGSPLFPQHYYNLLSKIVFFYEVQNSSLYFFTDRVFPNGGVGILPFGNFSNWIPFFLKIYANANSPDKTFQ